MLCRNADSSVLKQAVQDALLCTHVHPEGIEGAFILAAAVAALCRATAGKSSAIFVRLHGPRFIFWVCVKSLGCYDKQTTATSRDCKLCWGLTEHLCNDNLLPWRSLYCSRCCIQFDCCNCNVAVCIAPCTEMLPIRLCFSTDQAGPGSSPKALLSHLQKLSTMPAMQDKLQILSDALANAPQPQPGSCFDGSNWEGDINSEAWQYDCEVHAKTLFLYLLHSLCLCFCTKR